MYGLDLGLHFSMAHIQLEMSTFFNRYRNLIAANNQYQLENTGQAQMRGLELSLRTNFSFFSENSIETLDLSSTWQEALDTELNTELTRRPQWTHNVVFGENFNLAQNKFSASLQWQTSGPFYANSGLAAPAGRQAFPSSQQWHAQMTFKQADFQYQIRGRNLTDSVAIDPMGYTLNPRSLWLSFQSSF